MISRLLLACCFLVFGFLIRIDECHAAKRKIVLLVCTVNQECASLLYHFGGEESSPVTDVNHFARRMFQAKKFGDRHYYVYQPLFGGPAQDKSNAVIKEAVRWFRKRGDEVVLMVGYGTAGGNSSKVGLGDVLIEETFHYQAIKKKNTFSKQQGPIKFDKRIAPMSEDLSTQALSMLMKPVPYNHAPKVVRGGCLTVNGWVSLDLKKKIKDFSCFQMNDYITAQAAAEMDVPYFALRVISDIDTLPETFVQTQRASALWLKLAFNEEPQDRVNDGFFYYAFRSYYLAQAAKILKKILL